MSAIDLFWHLANLFAVSLLFGLLATVGAKLCWRRWLASVTWAHLAGAVTASAMLVALGGLVAFGRDGRMATYLSMVVVAAVVINWVGRRRRA